MEKPRELEYSRIKKNCFLWYGAQKHTKGNLHTRHYSIPMKKIVGFSEKFTKIWLLNGEMKIFLLEDLNLLFQLEIFIIT